MPTRGTRSWSAGRRRTRQIRMGAAGALVVLLCASLTGLAGCASTSAASASSPTANLAAATATADAAGNWQTLIDISGSSTSSGGGINQDTSESSTTVSGAYRVLAACQGSGSLQITLKPGGSIALPCTSAKHDLVRIAGSDSAPADETLDITVDRQGNVEWSDVQVQVRV